MFKMNPIFFSSPVEFRKWLEENHETEKEILVGFHKVATGKPSMSWSESVDQAICFGWIDGIRKSIDNESYSIRFTPRKPKSIWSAVNMKKIEELTTIGLIQPAGISAYEKRETHRTAIYSYENKPTVLPETFDKKFRANEKAWNFFQKQAPTYKKTALYLVMSAKQEITRLQRMETLISDSEASLKIKSLRR